jgi:hypothetical protein
MMFDDGPVDLGVLDRNVARAHDTIVRLLPTLDTKEGREAARSTDPFANLRDVSGQTAYRALQERASEGIDAPHRDALLRWVHELLQTRVAWDLVLDEADALHEPDPSLNARARRPGAGDAVLKTYAEAFAALIRAPHEHSAETAFRRLGDLAAPVAAVRKELRERRFEVSRRLGLSHPWSLATSDLGKLEALARAVLGQTDPLMTELVKDLRKRSATAAHSIHDGFAREAQEGWPARLGPRWLEDVFRAIAPRAPRSVPMPEALGGASFLRAADAWGRALRLAGTARSLPFALTRDPYATEPLVVGGVLASVVAGQVFAKRKLGLTLSRRALDTHVRSLGRTLFVALRMSAASVLLGIDTSADACEEIGARVFGSPLSRELGLCWSYGGFAGISRHADIVAETPARLIGAVGAFDLAKNLVDRFDEDWFDNPRAGAHLASIGAGPVWYGDVPESSRAAAIARAFEEMLG